MLTWKSVSIADVVTIQVNNSEVLWKSRGCLFICHSDGHQPSSAVKGSEVYDVYCCIFSITHMQGQAKMTYIIELLIFASESNRSIVPFIDRKPSSSSRFTHSSLLPYSSYANHSTVWDVIN